MKTALAVPRQQFVALTPGDVPGAQQGIATWCKQKIQTLGGELREQRQNLAQAKAAKWKHSGWLNAVSRTKARMIYYAKIKAAVEAGYLIVPNFDCEIMAVRVNRQRPKPAVEIDDNRYCNVPNESLVTAEAEILPQGVGRYVDNRMFYQHTSYTEKKDGKDVQKHEYRVTGYDEPDFPVLAVKPEVLAATERAMSLNLFDRIGVVTGRKQDPVVIGELIHPLDKRWQRSSHVRRVSFFIAWWLDTDSL